MLHADIGDLQHAIEIVDVNDLRDDEIEVIANEMQKLGERTSRWIQDDVWWLTEKSIATSCRTNHMSIWTERSVSAADEGRTNFTT